MTLFVMFMLVAMILFAIAAFNPIERPDLRSVGLAFMAAAFLSSAI